MVGWITDLLVISDQQSNIKLLLVILKLQTNLPAFYLDFYVQTNIKLCFGAPEIFREPQLLAKAFPSKVGKYVQNKK